MSQNPYDAPQTTPEPRRRRTPLILFGLLVVLVLFAVAFLMFLRMKPVTEPTLQMDASVQTTIEEATTP